MLFFVHFIYGLFNFLKKIINICEYVICSVPMFIVFMVLNEIKYSELADNVTLVMIHVTSTQNVKKGINTRFKNHPL